MNARPKKEKIRNPSPNAGRCTDEKKQRGDDMAGMGRTGRGGEKR